MAKADLLISHIFLSHLVNDFPDNFFNLVERKTAVKLLQCRPSGRKASIVQQNKTGAKLRISVEGQLESVLRRCKAAKERHSVHSLSILTNETGQPLTKAMLRGRFEKARKAAAGTASTEVARSSLLGIQFRDLRAKAATDKTDNAGDIRQAQKQLGHTTVGMTENYVRSRRGEKVKPTK